LVVPPPRFFQIGFYGGVRPELVGLDAAEPVAHQIFRGVRLGYMSQSIDVSLMDLNICWLILSERPLEQRLVRRDGFFSSSADVSITELYVLSSVFCELLITDK
jgi:hypothetical protein